MRTKTNRRSFLMATGMTAAAATRAWGANETLRLGAIGMGGRMRSLLQAADAAAPFQLVAACDVYGPNLEGLGERFNVSPTKHLDYREVLRQQLDGIIIAVPDHSHVRVACDAIAAGRDVYLEKPVTHTIEESAELTRTVRSSKQILQCGMQQRSWRHFQSAVDLIQGGNIGRITQVRTYWYQNYQQRRPPAVPINPMMLDWKRWLGSAPDQPFSEEKFRRWRWFWNFGGGAMTDLFAHWIDVVHWAMNVTEPAKAQMIGDKYFFHEWDCPDTVQAGLRYRGFDVGYEGTMVSSIDDGGLEFRGTEGTLKLTRAGFEIYREHLKQGNPTLSERSYQDGTISHMENFFECLKSRKQPNAPVETGVAAAQAGHIANLAFRGSGQVNWPERPS